MKYVLFFVFILMSMGGCNLTKPSTQSQPPSLNIDKPKYEAGEEADLASLSDDSNTEETEVSTRGIKKKKSCLSTTCSSFATSTKRPKKPTVSQVPTSQIPPSVRNQLAAIVNRPTNGTPVSQPSYPIPSPPQSPNEVTKGNCSYSITALEKQILDELNFVRTQPARYAAIIAQNSNSPATQEAIAELKNLHPLTALNFSQCLARAAQDHVRDTGPKGIRGHEGSDGSSLSSRIKRYTQTRYGAAENISYGMDTARNVIIQLIVDDGVPNRGHRKNILRTNNQSIGISCGSHKEYRIMCVQDFSFEKIP